MSFRLSISNQLPRLILISHCSASLIILREDYVEVTLLEQVLEISSLAVGAILRARGE